MNAQLTPGQIASYRESGFLVIDDFLDPEELENWRRIITGAVANRKGDKLPGRKKVYGEGDDADSEYYDNVFDQLLNLWQDNPGVRELLLDERIGRMATELSGADGIRVWHDQALIKKPWANPTSLHLDTPYWSFSDERALSIWVALDDATLENGCLFFLPGTHRQTDMRLAGIGKNMGDIFQQYPELAGVRPVAGVMKAGSCSFHNGLTIHGAHANMTPGLRRAFTCAFMPDGSTFNGTRNILSDEQLAQLNVGDPLNDDAQNPLIYHSQKGEA